MDEFEFGAMLFIFALEWMTSEQRIQVLNSYYKNTEVSSVRKMSRKFAKRVLLKHKKILL